MKVIIAHNSYQVKGGEDAVVKFESELLTDYGDDVDIFIRENDEISSLVKKIKTFLNVHYSTDSYRVMLQNIGDKSPDVVHVHNFFPLFSPSIFEACLDRSVPTVLTLHNFRTICPTALLMWKDKICERSLSESAYWAVPQKVYKNSILGTLALAHMIEYHKKRGTWDRWVTRYICLTEFAKSRFVAAGFPESKISIKPNFIPDPGYEKNNQDRGYGLFLGRLSKEKGLDVALDAWKNVDFPLKVLGEGDVLGFVPSNVEILGRKPKDEVISFLRGSKFLVMPSVWYEGFPMVILEAFACGVPVVCSRLGSMAEIVTNGLTGLHFEPGNALDLAEKIQWMIDHSREAAMMGENARQEYQLKYTPEENYRQLKAIYQTAITESK